ncbi:2,3-bisphosphoglycerate-dependent phosphoglycerate mutase [Fructobacillus parabroussonetiae]|uniref:2,3-bisphosphoglycerate-dependent phosphoglycerate mutase n=1 Tax=Fructobacillus parabroussonetiae TaxID=2713174 RepID=A0ABS5R003_9LACO|nr:2,3-diphosphoglycerate-dependent phosphoglycerate mutase [Fructobacillus parabroussonetiae]MBS9337497.1 2,3-diphosphoglycerate-dependent phosphoglycerate mutase [Fructobacillus parabroussonetiae]MCK8617027.1 2,3-diphosphoglycerate-dependent phosphoglycerate mutase [Fructobacillus parabroussonetiae]
MPTLVLIRHGQSEWNKKNRFNGWIDTKLSDTGKQQAILAGQLLQDQGLTFHRAYSSVLTRTIMTINRVLETLGQTYVPQEKTWRLNERHYGILQGENKEAMRAKYGADQVQTWRRSYRVLPPEVAAIEPTVTIDGRRYPAFDARYQNLPFADLPKSENIHTTEQRVQPFYEEKLLSELRRGHDVLVVAHGTSIRALTKLIEGLTPEEVTKVEIPNGQPILYDFSNDLTMKQKTVLTADAKD